MDKDLMIKNLNDEIDNLLDEFKTNLLSSLDDNLELDKSNMILDVENFIFEMNKENNLLTVALKEFIEYYIKYKQ